YPLDFLAVRYRVFSQLIGARRSAPTNTVPTTGQSILIGVPPRFPSLNAGVERYLDRYATSVVQRSIVYAALILLAAALARRRGPGERFLAAVGLGSVLYVASFF